MSLGRRIGLLSRLMPMYLAPRLLPLNIAVGEVGFLAALFSCDGVTQDALSCRLHLDKAATARAMSSLERKGLIERTVNPENRRSNIVRLTDKAHALREPFHSVLREINAVMAMGMEPDEIVEAVRLLDLMTKNLKTAL